MLTRCLNPTVVVLKLPKSWFNKAKDFGLNPTVVVLKPRIRDKGGFSSMVSIQP